jgi:hypothetical protein
LHKIYAAVLVLALTTLTVFPLSAQNDAAPAGSALHFGQVNMSWLKSVKYTPTGAQFAGGVKMTSENYDLSCETLTFIFEKPSGKVKSGGIGGALSKATAESNPATGAQVIADIRRPLEGQTFHVLADQAVYVPDKTRPGGVALHFTGHVQVITSSGFFAEPSVMTTDEATFLLGTGADYPQLNTGPGHITVTPAQ